MVYRACARTGLTVSALALGCWSFGGGEYWGEQKQSSVNDTVRAAFDHGVTCFDTAEAYNEGRSEESLGTAIRSLPIHRLVVGTKISPSNTHADMIEAHLDASLRRLKTDYIDFYLVHWPITPRSIRHFGASVAECASAEKAFEVLASMREKGKVRHVGVSNFGMRPLTEAISIDEHIAVNELPYSLVSRAIENEILPHCAEVGIGVFCYMPLQQGLLAGRCSLAELPNVRRRTRHFDRRRNPLARHTREDVEQTLWATVQRLQHIAEDVGIPLHNLALNWVYGKPGVTSVLVGARNPEQLEANLQTLEYVLPSELVDRLDEATAALKHDLGPSADYYEDAGNDRTL